MGLHCAPGGSLVNIFEKQGERQLPEPDNATGGSLEEKLKILLLVIAVYGLRSVCCLSKNSYMV